MRSGQNLFLQRRKGLKLIVCLSDDGGMMFNHRRQSRDRILIADMVQHTKDSTLWISPYSASLFPEDRPHLQVTPDPTKAAGKDDYCFVEDIPLPQNLEEVNELLIYRWNRLYPSDVFFTCNMSVFFLAESHEFVGSSHDNITKEIWKK